MVMSQTVFVAVRTWTWLRADAVIIVASNYIDVHTCDVVLVAVCP